MRTYPGWSIHQLFRIVLDPRLRDLQLLVLELFHLVFWSRDHLYHSLC